MTKFPIALVAAAIVISLGAGQAVHAGFTAQTSLLTVNNTDDGTPGGSVGDSFNIGGAVVSPDAIAGGAFLAFLPDTPFDPQITGGDLNLFRFNLSGTIASVNANVVNYDGDYLLFYDVDGDGEPNEGITVSAGDFAGTATFDVLTGETAEFLGTLSQTQGPNNPNFADLSYGGTDIVLTGTYLDGAGIGPSPTGTLTATLRQNAVAVPEPATLALSGMAVIASLAIRRREK
jgi:hypothetical protein